MTHNAKFGTNCIVKVVLKAVLHVSLEGWVSTIVVVAKLSLRAGLPFGRFDSQIPPFWPFFKAVGRRKLI